MSPRRHFLATLSLCCAAVGFMAPTAAAVDAVTVDASGNVLIGTDPGGTAQLRAQGVIRAGNVLSGKDSNVIQSAANPTLTLGSCGIMWSVSATAGDYTITLPAPAAVDAGQTIGFKCDGSFSSNINQVKVSPGAGTIAGRAATKPITLVQGNVLVLMATGANTWSIVSANLDTDWLLAPSSLQAGKPHALTTDPTLGTATVDANNCYWKRSGGSVMLRYEFSKSLSGTATNGTGIYLWDTVFPLDTTKFLVGSFANPQSCGAVAGYGYVVNATTESQQVTVGVYSSNRLAVIRNGAIIANGSTGLAASNVIKYMLTTFPLPVQDW